MLEDIRDLYAYSAWANARILDTAEQLTPEQFTTQCDGCGSIRDTLVHTASAQWLWLERWRGTLTARAVGPGRLSRHGGTSVPLGRGRGGDIGVRRHVA